MREERDSLRSAPQNNLLLDLLASNKQMVNSKDPFFMMDYLMKNIVYEDGMILSLSLSDIGIIFFYFDKI